MNHKWIQDALVILVVIMAALALTQFLPLPLGAAVTFLLGVGAGKVMGWVHQWVEGRKDEPGT